MSSYHPLSPLNRLHYWPVSDTLAMSYETRGLRGRAWAYLRLRRSYSIKPCMQVPTGNHQIFWSLRLVQILVHQITWAQIIFKKKHVVETGISKNRRVDQNPSSGYNIGWLNDKVTKLVSCVGARGLTCARALGDIRSIRALCGQYVCDNHELHIKT